MIAFVLCVAAVASGGTVYLMRQQSEMARRLDLSGFDARQLQAPLYDPLEIRAAVVANMLKESMRNPDDFELQSVQVMKERKALCFTYHARNALGDIVPVRAALAPNGVTLRTEGMPEFASLWNSECAGKTGRDIREAVRASTQ